MQQYGNLKAVMSERALQKKSRTWSKIRLWARKSELENKAAYLLLVGLVVCGAVAYALFSSADPLSPTPTNLYTFVTVITIGVLTKAAHAFPAQVFPTIDELQEFASEHKLEAIWENKNRLLIGNYDKDEAIKRLELAETAVQNIFNVFTQEDECNKAQVKLEYLHSNDNLHLYNLKIAAVCDNSKIDEIWLTNFNSIYSAQAGWYEYIQHRDNPTRESLDKMKEKLEILARTNQGFVVFTENEENETWVSNPVIVGKVE